MFVGLAEFTEKTNQLDKERRGQVRAYIIIPYIGAILIVITTALMTYLIAGKGLGGGTGGGVGNSALLAATTTTLFTAAFFQAWVMGIVAGKMGELRVSDGFKHATVIVIISLIAAYAATFFVNFS